MSTHDWLLCEESRELVEIVATVGGSTTPRIDPNVLGAFLLYHRLVYPGAVMRICDIDSLDIGRGIYESEAEREMFGNKLDYIAWKPENYRDLAGRNPAAKVGLGIIESAGYWVWTRR